jgi:hypothetical protein
VRSVRSLSFVGRSKFTELVTSKPRSVTSVCRTLKDSACLRSRRLLSLRIERTGKLSPHKASSMQSYHLSVSTKIRRRPSSKIARSASNDQGCLFGLHVQLLASSPSRHFQMRGNCSPRGNQKQDAGYWVLKWQRKALWIFFVVGSCKCLEIPFYSWPPGCQKR